MVFLDLGYPELAIGDLYKAKILIEEIRRQDSPVGAAAFLTFKEVVAKGSRLLREKSPRRRNELACLEHLYSLDWLDRPWGRHDPFCGNSASCAKNLSRRRKALAQKKERIAAVGSIGDQPLAKNQLVLFNRVVFPIEVKVKIHKALNELDQEVHISLSTALTAAGSGLESVSLFRAYMDKPHYVKEDDKDLAGVMEAFGTIDPKDLTQMRRHLNQGHVTHHTIDDATWDPKLLRRAYPWIPEGLLCRDDNTLEVIRQDFSGHGATVGVDQSRFLKSLFPNNAPPDLYGMYAKCDVSANTVMFFDQGTIHATAAPKRCPTCAERLPAECLRFKCPECQRAFCNFPCWFRAALEVHDKMCGRNFNFLYQGAKKASVGHGRSELFGLEPLLLLRVLASILNPNLTDGLEGILSPLPPDVADVVRGNLKSWTTSDVNTHPLKAPIVARLTANYDSDVLFYFSYEHQIVNPTRLLQTLGIDVFANLSYDTWVLETIRHRLCNNRLGAQLPGRRGQTPHMLMALHPCYAMLNHSCEPNVAVAAGRHGAPAFRDGHGAAVENASGDGEGAMITILAMRDIKAGEELFVSYIGGVEHMSREQRNRRLMAWLGKEGCKCPKCEREGASA
jgi:hypothetical protein